MSTTLTWQLRIHRFVIRSTIWFGRRAEFRVLNTWKDQWYPLSVLYIVIFSYYHFYTVVNCPLPGQDLCGFLTIYILNDNLLSPRMLFIPCSRCTGPSFDKVVVNTLCLQEAGEGPCASLRAAPLPRLSAFTYTLYTCNRSEARWEWGRGYRKQARRTKLWWDSQLVSDSVPWAAHLFLA